MYNHHSGLYYVYPSVPGMLIIVVETTLKDVIIPHT